MSDQTLKNEAFYKAAREGNFDQVKALLDTNVDIHYKQNGISALEIATYNGHKKIVKLILDRLSNPMEVILSEPANKSFPNNLLQMAVVRDFPAIILLLLNYFPDNAERVKALLKENRNRENSISLAATSMDAQSAQTLSLILNYFPNPAETIFKALASKDSPLLRSLAKIGLIENIAFLFKFLDINQRLTILSTPDSTGNVPLDYSMQTGSSTRIEFLLSQGSYIFDKKKLAEVLKEQDDTIKQLFQSLATIFYSGKTCSEELITAVSVLKTCVNARSLEDNGNTTIHHAIQYDNAELAYHLLAAGATLDIPNDHGKTALDMAKEKSQPYFVALLNLFKAEELAHKMTAVQNQVLEKSAIPSKSDVMTFQPSFDKKDQTETLEVKQREEKVAIEDQKLLQENFVSAALAVKQLIANIQNLPQMIQDNLRFKMGKLLAPIDPDDNPSPPLDPIAAYEALSAIDQNSAHYKQANKLMYYLLAGHLTLEPIQGLDEEVSVKPIKIEPKKEHAESKEESEEKLQKEKITLEAKIKHFLLAGLENDPTSRNLLYHHLAEYVYRINWQPEFGQGIFDMITNQHNIKNNPTAFMAQLKFCRALAEINPDHELLPTRSAAKPMVTQFKQTGKQTTQTRTSEQPKQELGKKGPGTS